MAGLPDSEAAAGESRLGGLRGGELLLGLELAQRVVLVVNLFRQLLAPLLLVVLALHVAELARKALHLVLELVDLGLVHVQLAGHTLHLPRLLAQRGLVDPQLLGHLGAWLPRQDVLQFAVKLLLLLDQQVLLHHFLRLGDEPLLQHLDLLHHFKRGRVAALQLPPAVHVHRVLQLLRQRFHLGLLLQKLALRRDELPAQVVQLRRRAAGDGELSLHVAHLQAQDEDVCDAVRVLRLAFAQRGDLDLEFLVEEGQLVVPADELRPQQVALHDDLVVLLLLRLSLVAHPLDNGGMPADLSVLLLDHVVVRLEHFPHLREQLVAVARHVRLLLHLLVQSDDRLVLGRELHL
mmetsp:Transcript_23417/g.79969  ORF Transcript_23417/g.79969 Transcript_23417/m.79969 type:complete len:349 (-) Transcript_23417:1680-2726(-)